MIALLFQPLPQAAVAAIVTRAPRADPVFSQFSPYLFFLYLDVLPLPI